MVDFATYASIRIGGKINHILFLLDASRAKLFDIIKLI
jgi:hypothetical protein